MKKGKILALLLAGVMATTVLGGCGSKGSDSSSSSSKASSDEKVLNFGCAMYTDGSVNTVTFGITGDHGVYGVSDL